MSDSERDGRDRAIGPEIIDVGGPGRYWRAEPPRTTPKGPSRTGASRVPGALLRRLRVMNGAVIGVGELAPPGESRWDVSAATMVCEAGRWQAHPWWPDGYQWGLLPVALDRSPVIEVSRTGRVRRLGVFHRWWTARWYWTLLSADYGSATFWGPFASVDELVLHRSPLIDG